MGKNIHPTNIKTGIGYSEKENSFEAGVEVAEKALNNTQLKQATLFLLFATPHHKVDELIRGVISIIGDGAKILGCTTTGLVTNDFISYTGILAGGALISSAFPFFKIFAEENLNDREFEAGKNLAKQLRSANTSNDASCLLFYDSIKVTTSEGELALNVATSILEGFYAEYNYWPTIAGVGAWGDINVLYPCAVWANQNISRHGLIAASITEPVKMHTIIMHGTRPVGNYHTITKAEQNIIYEIDNRPALDVIDHLMGGSVAWEEFPLLVTLGVNNGDKFADYKEENYASRLCLSIDKNRKALIMFENDLREGTEIQLMRRNIDFTYIHQQVNKLLSKIEDRKPLLAFYIDCLGRVSAFSGIQEEESLEVIKTLGDIPFFGLFSGVEIANVANTVRALDWTGVLCLFTESK